MCEFLSFAKAHGLDIRDLRADDRIHRCPTTDHPGTKNGAYRFNGDWGWIQDWSTGEPPKIFNGNQKRDWTEEDRRELAERLRSAEAEVQRGYAEAAKRAGVLIANSIQDVHGYLAEKGFPDTKALVLDESCLLIPMRDVIDNTLLGVQTVQLVDNRWQKRMIPRMRAKGAVFRIGPQRAAECFLCEGFATGLSISAAIRLLRLNANVIVCFSAGNLQHVAAQTQGRRFVFADNDTSQTGEKAALATGLPWCMSDQVGEDANDAHQRAGIMAVSSLLMKVRQSRRLVG